MKQIEMINKQIDTIRYKGFNPIYISFNLNGYSKFIFESQSNSFPYEILGLLVVVNPHQNLSVVVLSDPTTEFTWRA